jgi:hypothetical protein
LRWAAVSSMAARIGCSPHSVNEWVEAGEIDYGKRAGAPTEVVEREPVTPDGASGRRRGRPARPIPPFSSTGGSGQKGAPARAHSANTNSLKRPSPVAPAARRADFLCVHDRRDDVRELRLRPKARAMVAKDFPLANCAEFSIGGRGSAAVSLVFRGMAHHIKRLVWVD